MLKFASISYLNLLPFQIFIKKHIASTQIKQIMRYRRSIPSQINQEFKKKRIDAAFISSIKSKNQKCTKAGIIANKKVYSVLLIQGEQLFDSESDTSNALAQVLNLSGQIIIGDKALRYYLNGGRNFKDLCDEWHKKHNLPFVFARLCFNSKSKKVAKIANKFLKQKQKIPQYYLKKEAKKKGVSTKELLWYLDKIYYKIGYKEEKALKLFLKKAKIYI